MKYERDEHKLSNLDKSFFFVLYIFYLLIFKLIPHLPLPLSKVGISGINNIFITKC